jgi:hypothetical protein
MVYIISAVTVGIVLAVGVTSLCIAYRWKRQLMQRKFQEGIHMQEHEQKTNTVYENGAVSASTVQGCLIESATDNGYEDVVCIILRCLLACVLQGTQNWPTSLQNENFT